MALAKKCDRCGKFYEHYPIGNIPGEYNALEKVRLGKHGAVEYRSSDMDLCPDCMNSFVKFMKGSKVVGVENNKQRNEKTISIDTSNFTFEEHYRSRPGYTFLYFTAPRDLVADKYPDAEHATICIEWSDSDKEIDNYSVTISPTKNGEDYDWMPFELDAHDVEQLIAKGFNEILTMFPSKEDKNNG